MRSLQILFTVLSISCLISLINCGPILTKSSVVKNVKETKDLSLRLPKTSKPTAYEIHLKTGVHNGSRAFEGSVVIKLVILEATDTVIIHSKRLNINELVLLDASEKEVALTYTEQPTRDFINIEIIRRILNPNERYTLKVSYTGFLNTETSGFYRSSYQLDGVTRYLAVTQFESTDARAAFPSYDEPEYKATFDVSLVHDSSYSAIANTDGKTTANADGSVTTTFETTPVMSSYLLAFIVSDFEFRSNAGTKLQNETLHRVYMRPDAINRSDLALINSIELLKQLEDFVKIKFELPTMNSAAIPDFAAGAMENWGLITYTEQYLIGDLKSSHKEIISIIQTIAHELGHQFFGNLVTCQWWESIWLNEGFATLFEYLLLEKEYPDMRWVDLFNVEKLRSAFRSDSTEATRPMTTGAQTPSEISNLFDDIAYAKSGSVIRMFQYAVGEELFRAALNLYLMTNNHMPVTPKNLYTAFQTTMDTRNFKEFDFENAFKTWELQKGYPMIHVKYASNNFEITQQRYLSDHNHGSTPNSTWYIPLNYATAGTPNFEDTTISHYFKDTEAMKMIPVTMAPNQWFIFNKQGLGYYRVNYEFENWHEIIKTLNSPNFNTIDVLNRAQILDDSITFAVDGYLDYDVALGIMQYLHRETDYVPWATVLPMINYLDMMLGTSPLHAQYQMFILSLVKRMYAKYGMEEFVDDTLIDKHARETAINLACKMGHSECLYDAFVALHLETHQKKEIPASLQAVLYCHGLRNNDTQTEFVYLYKKMQASNDHAERNRIIEGLTCSEDPKLLKDLLETTVGNTEVNYKPQERTRIMNRVYSRSTIGKAAVLDFVSNFYDEINNYYGPVVDGVLIGVSKRIVMYEDQVKITAAMDKLSEKLQATTRIEVLKNIDNNKLWLSGNAYVEISDYVDSALKKLEKELNMLRLPKTTVPLSYKVNLIATSLHNGSRLYDGEVTMKIVAKEVTDRIMLHAKDQTITELNVFESDNITPVKLIEYTMYGPAETLTIHLMNNVMLGSEYILNIKFSAQLRTSGSGFYQTSYIMNGTTRYLGATQFQATGARYAFPCYDEPSFKATFEMIFKHDVSFNAIANTEAVRTVNADGSVTTSFSPSPVMSSYLVAFVISDLEFISNALTKGPNETLHRIYSRPNAVKLTPFALDNSEKLLQVLERYVDYKYELAKIDSAAIPQKGGAMENWGLVLYSEDLMIYEENYNDISHTQRLGGVSTIAHELSHQFFGNLLTCDWWSSIWLNEGFATVFEYLLVDTVNPDWNMKAFFNLRQMHRAYRTDALQSTRAMTTDLNTITEISQSFDNIAYNKAGSVIRMFQYAVGETIFREALNLYLKTNNHMPVTPTALHTAFQTTMDTHNIKDFDFPSAFKTWELQKGYPIIHVKYADNNFHITQKRYLTEANVSDNSTWYIPLNYATAGTPNFEDTTISHYFKDTEAMKMIPVTMAPNQWFIFNKQGLGYYRVNYEFENWHEIIKTLNSPNFNTIDVLNRAQILDDALSFASIGLVDYDLALGLLQYLHRETDYVPWGTVDIFLNSLISTFGGFNTVINQFIGMLSKELYESFEIIDNIIPYEPLVKRYGREMAFKWACRGGNEKCLDDTYDQVHLVAHHSWVVPKGLEAVVYCSGLRGVDKRSEWVNMWLLMQNSTDKGDRSRIIAGLGCTEDLELLNDYLETTLGSNNDINYSVAERLAVFNSVLSSSVGVEAILKFLTKFELEAVMLYRTSLESLLSSVARTVKTQKQLTMLINYLGDNDSLAIEIFRSVTNIAGNNLKLQQSQQFAPIMTIINQYVEKINEVTEAPSTTVVMETSTATVTTTAPLTTAATVTTEASITTSQTSTAVPTTVPTSTETATTVTVPSTTQGAASNSFKLITLLTCITTVLFLM